ncbi:MAG: glucoamylase family protein [Saprospiraceae bacterium]
MKGLLKLTVALLCLTSIQSAHAQVFFSDSDQSGYYDSGLAISSGTSLLKQVGPSGDKLPLAPTAFVDHDALELSWTSNTGGDWSAIVLAPNFASQDVSPFDTLGFWVYSSEVLAKAEMPFVFLEGAPGTTRSAKYPMGDFTPSDLAANEWALIRIPLDVLRDDPANSAIDFTQIKAVIFGQGTDDGSPHQLYVDQVACYQAQVSPSGDGVSDLEVTNYPLHRELLFKAPAAIPVYYGLLRDDILLQLITPGADTLLLDWPENGDASTYQLTSYTPGFGQGTNGQLVSSPELPPIGEEILLDMTQEYSLRYFWDFRHPVSGLSRERNTTLETVTTGGSGFGLMAWLVGIERGWLSRQEVTDQLLTTLTFLEEADRFHGVWPHWLNGTTGNTIPFSTLDNGGDLVETAFMAQALLTARQYFDNGSPAEDSIQARATRLWEEIEWDWHQKPGTDFLMWHWSPNFEFQLNLPIRGFNESQIVYILAAASPTYPVDASLYESGWITSTYRSQEGRNGVFIPTGPRSGGPIFFAHYSYLGFDPRYWRDDYTNYFRRNQMHVDYQVAYSIENPEGHVGYSEQVWGLTASDDPLVGYLAHEAEEAFDNGTITPTAALASMPYRPAACLDALEAFYSEYGEALLGTMGFRDAFNPSQNWIANSYLAIDQGPIVLMIENYRTGLLWDKFMSNLEIAPALTAIGFSPDSTTVSTSRPVLAKALKVYPNPSSGNFTLTFLDQQLIDKEFTLELYNAIGQLAFRQNYRSAPSVQLQLPELAPGTYTLRTSFDEAEHLQLLTIIRSK